MLTPTTCQKEPECFDQIQGVANHHSDGAHPVCTSESMDPDLETIPDPPLLSLDIISKKTVCLPILTEIEDQDQSFEIDKDEVCRSYLLENRPDVRRRDEWRMMSKAIPLIYLPAPRSTRARYVVAIHSGIILTFLEGTNGV